MSPADIICGCLGQVIFAFRVIDCFVAMGPKVLFQIALAILKQNGEALLEVTDDGMLLK